MRTATFFAIKVLLKHHVSVAFLDHFCIACLGYEIFVNQPGKLFALVAPVDVETGAKGNLNRLSQFSLEVITLSHLA